MMQGSLAERLRVLRARRGLTLTEAARKAGVQRQTLALLERGERHPHMPTLTKIASGYGIPVEELLEEPALAGKARAPSETGAEVVPEIMALLRAVEEEESGISREELLGITAERLRARYSEENLRDAERQLLATYRSFDRSFESPMWTDTEQYEAWLELWDEIRAVQLARVAVGRALAAA